VLNACQSGSLGDAVEATVATRLLHDGAASVVAMSYSVYAVAAAEFMAAFYEALFTGQTVAAATPSGTVNTPKGGSHCAQWAISFFRQSVDIDRQMGRAGVVRIGVSGQERGEHHVSEGSAC
jgi:hypothetical protein